MIPLLLPDVAAPADKAAGAVAATEGETATVPFGAVLAGLRSGEGKDAAEGEAAVTPDLAAQEEVEETPVLSPELPEAEVTAPLAIAAADLPSGQPALLTQGVPDAALVTAPMPQPRGLPDSADLEMPAPTGRGDVAKADAATPPRPAASAAQVLFTQRTSAPVLADVPAAPVKDAPPTATPAPPAANMTTPVAINPPLDAVPAAAPALAKGLAIAQEAIEQGKGQPDRAQTTLAVPQMTPAAQTDMPPPAVSLMQSHAALAARWAEAGKAESAENLSKIADIDLGLVTTGGDRPAQTSGASPVLTANAPADMARHAAQQIAMAITQTNGKVTEISLNPEELGRVRLSLAAGEGAITLAISADRPETADLLRRHIDALAQEFRSLGYDSLTFSFGSGSGAAGSTASDDGAVIADTDAAPPVEASPVVSTQAAITTTGLDLRL